MSVHSRVRRRPWSRLRGHDDGDVMQAGETTLDVSAMPVSSMRLLEGAVALAAILTALLIGIR